MTRRKESAAPAFTLATLQLSCLQTLNVKVVFGSIVVLKPLIILESTKRPGTGRFRTTGSNADLTVYVRPGTNFTDQVNRLIE